MRKILSVFTLFLLMFVSVQAQKDQVAKKIIEIAKKDNQVMQHLDVLCNRFGGRLVGSATYTDACEWAVAQFKKWGMEVELDEVGEMPVGFNRGPFYGRMISPQYLDLLFQTPSYTAGTKGLQMGHVVIEPKDSLEFQRVKGKLKGAWVLLNSKNEGWPVDFYRAKNKVLFLQQMKEAGILGTIQAAEVPIRALFGKVDSWDNLPTTPDIKLDSTQFNIIKKAVIEKREVLLEFDIRNHFKMGPVKFYNVIGIIPGTKYPDEYVLMGGHLDSFDVATGAIDNGSGATPAMEAARLIMAAGGKPKRTILVTLWAAEEYGLVGSTHWVEKYKDKLPYISNMFNRDGGTNEAVGINAPEAMMKDMEQIVKPLLDLYPDCPFKLDLKKAGKRPKTAGGTDSQVFSVAGVPTLTFATKDYRGYNINYGETWHTESDYYQKVVPEYQEHTAVVTAVVVWGIANLDHLLSRDGYFLPDDAPDPQPKNPVPPDKK